MENKSFRSIFPRVESLYVATRAIVLLAIALWLVFHFDNESSRYAILILSVAFVAQTFHFYLYTHRLNRSYEKLLVYSLVFDVIFTTGMVYFTGGFNSNFYLLYYLSIGFGAYFLGLQPGLILSFAVTTMYSVLVSQERNEIPLLDLLLRAYFAWSMAFGIGVVAKYTKQSERKLLKLLDTLNVRTTELEQTQVQIENIYDTSRVLGEILNLEQLLNEINVIADSLWGYALFEVILLNPGTKSLEKVATVHFGEKRILQPPLMVRPDGVVGRTMRNAETVRIVDTDTCQYYIENLKGARSEMVVPMISRGKVIGAMNVESKEPGKFTERDQKLVSILASSAAMAVENARLHMQVSELAVIDELTGVHNFRYFTERLTEERRRSERYSLPLSLIMVDIDWFKRTNDTHGHEVGNVVLKELVGVIKECIRDTDRLCRYGGEEFIVILPQTSSPDALVISKRIREKVDAHEFGGYNGAPKLHVTVSVGVTSYPDNGLRTEELISAVDSALYQAKGSGKNQVCSV